MPEMSTETGFFSFVIVKLHAPQVQFNVSLMNKTIYSSLVFFINYCVVEFEILKGG